MSRKVKVDSLPRLQAVQLLGKGGFASVTAGQLIVGVPAGNDKTSDGETRRTLIPTDQPVVIKLFDDDVHTEAGIRESIFYETVFPLLPKETRAFLPHYYGTYRSSRGRMLALVMGYAGNPIPSAERSDKELQQQIGDAYKLFEKYGIDHSDRKLRNVVRRHDGSLCLIDCNLATLNFSPHFRGLKKEAQAGTRGLESMSPAAKP